MAHLVRLRIDVVEATHGDCGETGTVGAVEKFAGWYVNRSEV